MDKLTGKTLMIDGKNVTTTKTFIARAVNGIIDLEFTFDASEL